MKATWIGTIICAALIAILSMFVLAGIVVQRETARRRAMRLELQLHQNMLMQVGDETSPFQFGEEVVPEIVVPEIVVPEIVETNPVIEADSPNQNRRPRARKTKTSAYLSENATPVISEFMAENGSKQLGGDGNFTDWIELHNPSTKSLKLDGYFLTDDAEDLKKWKISDLSIAPGRFAIVVADDGSSSLGGEVLRQLQGGLRIVRINGRTFVQRGDSNSLSRHRANFKLSTKGEYLALVAPNGRSVVHEYKPGFPKQTPNVSYGIAGLGSEEDAKKFGYLAEPTPGAVNSAAILGFTPKVSISAKPGHYEKPVEVSLSCEDSEADIRYTLDGSTPKPGQGKRYEGPFAIRSTTVLRAAAFRANYKTLQPATATYLFLDDVAMQGPQTNKTFPRSSRVNGQKLFFGLREEVVQLYSRSVVAESLKSLPALCLTTDVENLFDSRVGIYVNAQSKGRSWERPASLELLNPDGTPGFQIDAGLRIRGGYSRRARNPKHAFRMVFRKEYGKGKLKFPLFGDEGTSEFDHIDFRTSLNYSWADEASSRNNFLRDVFSRDTQGDMGQPYTRSRFYHLFLNGHYWGIYQTQERAVAAFAASYLGGKEEDYDVVKTGGEVPDGNDKAFLRFYNEVLNGVTDSDSYYRLQGLNPDGTRNPKYEKLLDVNNLIDYMAVTYYTGDRDGPNGRYLSTPNNYYSIYNRAKPDGWKYFEHDSEHSMDTGDLDMTFPPKRLRGARSFNPHWLHDQLVSNEAYLKHFRERMDRHFGVEGELSRERVLARIERREREVAGGIIANAARWGSVDLNFETWQASVEQTKRWTDGRVEIVYDQFRERGWFPGPMTPLLSMRSATVKLGSTVYLTAQDNGDVIYYTLDGTDPRDDDGSPSPTARRIESAAMKRIVAVEEGAPVRAIMPTDAALDQRWMKTDFQVDSSWLEGNAPVGYESNSGYQNLISLDMMDTMFRENTTLYVRYEFELDEDMKAGDSLVLRMKFDDAFIAYLDGQKIASENGPDKPAWNSSAKNDNSDSKAKVFQDFYIPNIAVKKGRHVLAVHALDGSASSDFLMAAQLEVHQFNGESISIDEPVKIIARSYSKAEKLWSALRTGTFRVSEE